MAISLSGIEMKVRNLHEMPLDDISLLNLRVEETIRRDMIQRGFTYLGKLDFTNADATAFVFSDKSLQGSGSYDCIIIPVSGSDMMQMGDDIEHIQDYARRACYQATREWCDDNLA